MSDDELTDDQIDDVLNDVIDGHHDLLVALMNGEGDTNLRSESLSASWQLLQDAHPYTAELVAHYLDNIALMMGIPAIAERFDRRAFGMLAERLGIDPAEFDEDRP